MIKIFDTAEGCGFWLSQAALIRTFYANIQINRFAAAAEAAKQIEQATDLVQEKMLNGAPSEVLDDLFLASTAAALLKEFGYYWNLISVGQFSESWNHLQHIQDLLRSLFRFAKVNNLRVLDVIEKQCGCLEVAYPYRIFASVEMVYDGMECSICGVDISDPKCPHVVGNLYGGKLAIGKITNVRELVGVALVDNPRDKRCTIAVPDDSEQFHVLAYVRMLIAGGKFNPLLYHRMDKTMRPGPLKRLEASKRNVLCVCESGKKYKKCCLQKSHEHLNFVLSSTPVISMPDLLGV